MTSAVQDRRMPGDARLQRLLQHRFSAVTGGMLPRSTSGQASIAYGIRRRLGYGNPSGAHTCGSSAHDGLRRQDIASGGRTCWRAARGFSESTARAEMSTSIRSSSAEIGAVGRSARASQGMAPKTCNEYVALSPLKL